MLVARPSHIALYWSHWWRFYTIGALVATQQERDTDTKDTKDPTVKEQAMQCDSCGVFLHSMH